MPLASDIKLTKTYPTQAATLEASHKYRLEQELRAIHNQLNKLVDAVEELRENIP